MHGAHYSFQHNMEPPKLHFYCYVLFSITLEGGLGFKKSKFCFLMYLSNPLFINIPVVYFGRRLPQHTLLREQEGAHFQSRNSLQ